MQHGRSSDYQAPFRDRINAPREDEIARVAGIGKVELLAWWDRVKSDTSPATYGQTGHDFTSTVAYLVMGGPVSRRVYGDTDAGIRACRALGVEPNFTGNA